MSGGGTGLLLNAVEATPPNGEITITTDLLPPPPNAPLGQDKTQVRARIQDKGVGIAKENLDKVFDPFFSTKGTGEGTGLGLYVVSGILKNYGAAYHLESKVSQGTIFTLDFPLSHTPKF